MCDELAVLVHDGSYGEVCHLGLAGGAAAARGCGGRRVVIHGLATRRRCRPRDTSES